MRSGVVIFPGSNCDRDLMVALELVTGVRPLALWHADPHVPSGLDLIALPGGFSFGDYLRAGAIAARAPVMQAVAAHAARGGLVLGICNGFQVLTEAGLLPGALMRNAGLDFICRDVGLEVVTADSPFTRAFRAGERITIPIAHHDGNYQADEATLERLEQEGRVAFRYLDDVNGSAHRIAGILNEGRNVLGLMPHPERCVEDAHGNTDGRRLFEGLLHALATA
ncbi:MAG: phosphoribosylformylglycinamidine synthase subunit PurQ [Sphingomonadaceae bacterium]|uniref:phosphoribosylformylglycinamidine synthase subunit PurQ n=1 Tax=Thermaurantiacus sp. TaxID=2820283 RepID=UPI00298ED9D0|nr:phosphoribosylformylglycinamidine synthase subunit PurQ [Thermaurantiacus sp.]MCS6986594.1 phosphoribosylformylglycinamidine synthase subunit PurQ [Sphingomonadaceae bacterium]MDW8414145.1 phosphoribosylformylglycinamidine synthase subunit PurQ [Thermaurantiacus sp.]